MEELTKGDKKLLADIEQYGWHVVVIPEDEQGPGFGYSVGFYKTFKHPEVLIVGLKLKLIHILINNIGESIRKGQVYKSGTFYSDILDNFECLMLNVDKEFYKEYVGYDIWYYGNTDFPLMQCVYPTVKGIYPWEETWPKEIKDLQPILNRTRRRP